MRRLEVKIGCGAVIPPERRDTTKKVNGLEPALRLYPYINPVRPTGKCNYPPRSDKVWHDRFICP